MVSECSALDSLAILTLRLIETGTWGNGLEGEWKGRVLKEMTERKS